MAKEKDNAQVILDDVLRQLHSERASDMSESEYFEVFCAEQLLKDYDLSYEEIEAGIVDGEHDGGVDAIYAFVNGELITEDFDTTRPSSLIKDDKVYRDLFSEEIPVQVYSFAVSLIKRIESHLKAVAELTARDRNNLRFYVATYLVWLLAGTSPSAADIAKLDPDDLTDALVEEATNLVFQEYHRLGATDQVAKGPELKKAVRTLALVNTLIG